MKRIRLRGKEIIAAVSKKLLQTFPKDKYSVFLTLAAVLLVISFIKCYHRQFLSKDFSLPEQANVDQYVWLTGSPEHAEGLYRLTSTQSGKNFPGIHHLLKEEYAERKSPPVSAIQFNSGVPGFTDVPPNIANIFFQPIPINCADAAILTSLPGIGPVLADKIVEMRMRLGSFKSKNELLRIKGIGPKKFAQLTDRITID